LEGSTVSSEIKSNLTVVSESVLAHEASPGDLVAENDPKTAEHLKQNFVCDSMN